MTMKNLDLSDAQIYVGTYGKYNNGSIEGKWLVLSDYSDKDEFMEACSELHSDESDPEFMFQDWQNIPDDLIGESWISENFWKIVEAFEREGIDLDALTAYMELGISSNDLDDVEDLISDFNDAYQGDYSDSYNPELDFATQLFDECHAHEVPESIRYYIDYEAFARDIFIGDYSESNGYIFRDY